MTNKKLIVSDIEWDTDGQDADLPTEVTIELSSEDLEEIGEENDYSEFVENELSNKYGYLVLEYSVDEK